MSETPQFRDPTIYPVIHVFSEGGENLIAKFPEIKQARSYKVYLNNLKTPTDTFDLKVVSPDASVGANSTAVEFDYITDPTEAGIAITGGIKINSGIQMSAPVASWSLNEANCNAISGWHWYTTNTRSACWSKTLVDSVSWNKGVGNDTDVTGSYTCASLETYDLQTRMTAASAGEWYKIVSVVNSVTITSDHNGSAGWSSISALAISDCIDGTKDLVDCVGCSSWELTNTWLRNWAGTDGKSALPYLSTDAGTTQATNDYWDACVQSGSYDYPLCAATGNTFYLNRKVCDVADTNYSWAAASGYSSGNYWDARARRLGDVSCSNQDASGTSNANNYDAFRVVVRP